MPALCPVCKIRACAGKHERRVLVAVNPFGNDCRRPGKQLQRFGVCIWFLFFLHIFYLLQTPIIFPNR